jgi:hypothetical protein
MLVMGTSIAVGSTSPASAADDGELKRHVPGVFLGVTSGDGETDYTVGLEYEYRMTPLFGLGAVVETTPERHGGDGVNVALGAIHVHPMGGLRLTAGYGWEDILDATEKRAKGKAPSKNEDLFRIGAAYDFHVGNFGIAPSVNLDFVGGHEVAVFGIAIVRPF